MLHLSLPLYTPPPSGIGLLFDRKNTGVQLTHLMQRVITPEKLLILCYTCLSPPLHPFRHRPSYRSKKHGGSSNSLFSGECRLLKASQMNPSFTTVIQSFFVALVIKHLFLVSCLIKLLAKIFGILSEYFMRIFQFKVSAFLVMK